VSSDNDVLASRIASSLRADLLVLLTDMDALYGLPPGASEPVRLTLFSRTAPLVRSGIRQLEAAEAYRLSDKPLTGKPRLFAGRTRLDAQGLGALVSAAEGAVNRGVRIAVVASGLHPLALVKVLRGEDVGTLFLQPTRPPPSSTSSPLAKL